MKYNVAINITKLPYIFALTVKIIIEGISHMPLHLS